LDIGVFLELLSLDIAVNHTLLMKRLYAAANLRNNLDNQSSPECDQVRQEVDERPHVVSVRSTLA